MASANKTAVPGESLRTHLRAATMAAHDLLDHAMQAANGWQTRADYARFLSLQHAARAPLESWLAAHAPADLVPPPQTGLIAQDLARLGLPSPAPAPLFTIGRPGPGAALGIAWVLAGSALGNKAIVKQVVRIGGGGWPVAFLGDDGAMAFWQGLRARIERPAAPAEAEGATRAAEAVFAHFLGVAEGGQAEDAARESLPA
ncbi:MAG: biliverdin-producing heme oxygenase [Erythrobacter sp.]|uniref:biliverdin-producing heme oxygenase n=1 Tax=Erythrobacter sp. TaxID=1042 RepID=UPI0025F81764|nr:biliverdin-producing heme oxygenase [Erythrobacter sp.]MCL9999129.1 biliverdin-producing heme oxygenase [Erythrobacter sp.]